MLKKLYLILVLFCSIHMIYGMNESIRHRENNQARQERSTLNLAEQADIAWKQGDIERVKALTHFYDFLEKEDKLNLNGYLNKLYELELPLSYWYNYLLIEGINYIINDEGDRLLQHLIRNFKNFTFNIETDWKRITQLIASCSAEALNAANDNKESFTPLHEILGILKELDSLYRRDIQPYLKQITEELLKGGANPFLPDHQGLAFNESEFYALHKEEFEECQAIRVLRQQLREAYEQKDIEKIKTLTKFKDFFNDDDEIDVIRFDERLAELHCTSGIYDTICITDGINYKENNGSRYLHSLLRQWMDCGYNAEDFKNICSCLRNFSAEELSKPAQDCGTLLDVILLGLKEYAEIDSIASLIVGIIDTLIVLGADIQSINNISRITLLQHKDNLSHLNKIYVESIYGAEDEESIPTVLGTRDRNVMNISVPFIKKSSINKKKSFLKKYAKQTFLISAVGIGICYIAFRIFSGQNKSASPRIRLKR